MNLPELKNPTSYKGLYVVDFGDSSSVGYTADEVAELLESEKFAHIKVYKIHNATPDGQMELRGVSAEIFSLEAGIFFYAADEDQARSDYQNLVKIAITSAPPARAKVHLSKLEDAYVTALIYPAECDDDFSIWLNKADYKTAGPAQGGTQVVTDYYDAESEILERHQLLQSSAIESMTGDALLVSTKLAAVR